MSAMPVYRGYSSQYGAGLGNVLGGIFRAAVPILSPLLKSAGKQLLRTGARVGGNLMDRGVNYLDSRLDRLPGGDTEVHTPPPRRRKQRRPQRRPRSGAVVKRVASRSGNAVRKKKRTKRDILG